MRNNAAGAVRAWQANEIDIACLKALLAAQTKDKDFGVSEERVEASERQATEFKATMDRKVKVADLPRDDVLRARRETFEHTASFEGDWEGWIVRCETQEAFHSANAEMEQGELRAHHLLEAERWKIRRQTAMPMLATIEVPKPDPEAEDSPAPKGPRKARKPAKAPLRAVR